MILCNGIQSSLSYGDLGKSLLSYFLLDAKPSFYLWDCTISTALWIRIHNMTLTSLEVKWSKRSHWEARVAGLNPTQAACNFFPNRQRAKHWAHSAYLRSSWAKPHRDIFTSTQSHYYICCSLNMCLGFGGFLNQKIRGDLRFWSSFLKDRKSLRKDLLGWKQQFPS